MSNQWGAVQYRAPAVFVLPLCSLNRQRRDDIVEIQSTAQSATDKRWDILSFFNLINTGKKDNRETAIKIIEVKPYADQGIENLK